MKVVSWFLMDNKDTICDTNSYSTMVILLILSDISNNHELFTIDNNISNYKNTNMFKFIEDVSCST